MLPFNGLASRVTGRRGWLQAMDFSGYNPRLQCEVSSDAGASPLPFTGQRGRCPSGGVPMVPVLGQGRREPGNGRQAAGGSTESKTYEKRTTP